MSAPVLTFFNNKGGVGKTSLVYHLSFMIALLGKKVVVADLDPQANLTASFLTDDKIEDIWSESNSSSTIFQCVKPITGVGDISEPKLENLSDNLYLIPGDVKLSGFEETLSGEWPRSTGNDNLYRPMRILSSFWQIMQMASRQVSADLIIIDIGPNLGAINRSVLLATDYVAIPLGADLFSLQGLKNLGPTLKNWRRLWKKSLGNWEENPESKDHSDFCLPEGKMEPIGYLCQQHGVRLDKPVKAYDKWVKRIPNVYRESILEKSEEVSESSLMPEKDPYCLATIKHYRSLIPLAQEHRKPIFQLTPAEGAIGSHANSVKNAEQDFKELAVKIASKIGLEME